jgi:hypothetical protein
MSLSQRADSCLAELDPASQATARRVLLRLISFGDVGDDRADTPRQQPISALRTSDDPDDPARVAEVLRRLAGAQLLTIDGDEASDGSLVELEDATLRGAWPTLQTWIRSHRRTEELRRQLEHDAAEWSQPGGPGDSLLLDPAQLRELTSWLTPDTKRDLGVSPSAESFIAASRAAARPRWWPRQLPMASALAVMLILMLLATPIVLLLIVVLLASVIHKFN